MKSQHACIAIIGDKIISPPFTNHIRHCMFGKVCFSAHAESSNINYLINIYAKADREYIYSCVRYMIKKNEIIYFDDKRWRKFINKFKKIDLIVVRVSSDEKCLSFSKPCAKCIFLMRVVRINSVYYTNTNGVIEHELVNEIKSDHKTQSLKYLESL